MIAYHEERFELLQELREKGGFGISGQLIELSEQEVLAKEQEEKESYVRQYNPDEILDYISSIPKFDLREEFEPGSSTPEELEARCRELQYRADWLEALLYITNEELKLFDGALKTINEPQQDTQ